MAEGTTDTPHTYPQGVPCWIEHQAPDVDGAIAFYGGLFGWTFADQLPPEAPFRFLLASSRGKDAASVATADGPARWVTYIAVGDADAAAASAERAGGAVIDPAQDAGPAGRWAGIRDPQGAEFRVWQAGRRLGSQVNNAGDSWNFSDLRTTDPAAAMAYYGPILGWETADMGEDAAVMIRVPGYGDHLQATVDPGIRERQAGAPEGFADAIGQAVPTDAAEPPHWHVTFSVDDLDASVSTAERLGGTVLARRDGKWARTARVRDPFGAEFTLSRFVPQ